MREFGFQVSPALRKGIRPFKLADRNSDWLFKMNNLRCSPYGGVRQIIGTQVSLEDAVFPFPQIFNLQENLYVCDSEAIYLLNPNTLETTLVDFYNPKYPQYTSAIPSGGAWHAVAYHSTFAFWNGECVAYRTNADALVQAGENKAFVQTTVPLQTGCDYRGQLMVAGAMPGMFWDVNWTNLIEDMATRIPTGLALSLDVKSNFVFWSQIGGGDLTWLLDPAQAMTGDVSPAGYGTSRMFWYDMFKRGDMGFIPLPVNGSVRVLKVLGNRVICYTDDGLFALNPVVLDTGTPAFGLQLIAKGLSVESRSAVGGDEQRHYFVDKQQQLWQLTADLQLRLFRYNEYISSIETEEAQVILSWDDVERELHISGPIRGLILSEFEASIERSFGVSQTDVPIRSLINFQGTQLVAQPTFDPEEDLEFEIETDVFDQGNRNMKMIQSIEVGFEDITELQVKILWKNATGNYNSTPYLPCNPEGFVIIPCSGVDLKVNLKGVMGPDARINYITVNWKQTDKRDIRGVLANRGNASADLQNMG